ncbi:MAG: hypothetical protein V1742_09850, partial [Pseudomonadota bacterium]
MKKIYSAGSAPLVERPRNEPLTERDLKNLPYCIKVQIMIGIMVDGQEIEAAEGQTLLQVCLDN